MRIALKGSLHCKPNISWEGCGKKAFLGRQRIRYLITTKLLLSCMIRLQSTLAPIRIRMSSSWRSDERRVGKECVSTCRSRGSSDNKKKNNMKINVKKI